MNAPTSTPDSPLFRSEAMTGQRTPVLGQIVLTPRLSATWVSLIAAALAVAVIVFAFVGSLQRRVTVNGQLLPAGGVLRVHTPQAGVVTEKHVSEGQMVHKGDVLYVLSSDRMGEDSRELQADIASQLEQRKDSLGQELRRQVIAKDDELARLQRRLVAAQGEATAMAAQVDQQKALVSIARDTRNRYKGLADKDYIAHEELVQKDMALAEQNARLRALDREALALGRERNQLEQQIESTALRYDDQIAELEREMLGAEQQLTEVESRRRVVVTAPEDGRATLVTAEKGQRVDGAVALVTIVPSNSPLQARLYAPSSSIGFVKKDDEVLLRYQAFPYQKFGTYRGVVESVSTSAVTPSELSAVPAVNTSPTEPVYAITVKLDVYEVQAFGQVRPLQTGMQLEADILQERRKLYEWVLEPLYSVTRRMS
jgi:membrane fusion protein